MDRASASEVESWRVQGKKGNSVAQPTPFCIGSTSVLEVSNWKRGIQPMRLSTALEGYILYMSSGNFSMGTVRLYKDSLGHLVTFLEDVDVEKVTLSDLQRFILYMKTSYVPKRFSGETHAVSPSYVDIHWKVVRSFFSWASETLHIERPDLRLVRPKFRPVEVQPFSADEIKRLVNACEWSVEVSRDGVHKYRIHQRNHLRNKLLILILLDTGLRIGELCRLRIEDVNLTTGAILITPYETGNKTKPRFVYIGNVTKRQLWLYLAERGQCDPTERLIPLADTPIRKLMKSLEIRAKVTHVHPHRFRHTFAMEFLKNGGDVFNLQRLLGHSTLDMVKRYLALSNSDTAEAHR
jgi:integrase/recombinase XerD